MLELAATVLWSQLQVSSPPRKTLESYTRLPTYSSAVHMASLFLLLSSRDLRHASLFILPIADLVDIADTCTNSLCVDIELHWTWSIHGAVKKSSEHLKTVAYSWQPGRSPAFTFVAQISAPVADGKASISGWASGSCHSLNIWMLEVLTTDFCSVDCRDI